MRWKAVIVLGTVAAVLSGCTSTPEPKAIIPVVVAEPVPLEGTGLAPPSAAPSPSPPDRSAVEDSSSEPPDAAPEPAGPSSADAAAFVSGDALPDLAGVEHVVVDLDGDTWPEVVLAGIQERVGVVHVAWWSAGDYELLASGTAGPGRDVTDLRAADVNDDGVTELLVAVEGEGLRSLALWSVPRRGDLEPLEAVGGCSNGSHVYGVTNAGLAAQTEGPAVIVADCDESPLPVADWSRHRWMWEDGAYRHQQPSPPGPPGDGGTPGGGQGGGNDGGNQGGGQGSGNPGGGNPGGGNDGGDNG